MSDSQTNQHKKTEVKKEVGYDLSRLMIDVPTTATSSYAPTDRLRSIRGSSNQSSSSQPKTTPLFVPKNFKRKKEDAPATFEPSRRQYVPRQNFERRPERERVFKERPTVYLDDESLGLGTTDFGGAGGFDLMDIAEEDKQEIVPETKVLDHKEKMEEVMEQRRNLFIGAEIPPTQLPFKPWIEDNKTEDQVEREATQNLFVNQTTSDELLFLQLPSYLPIDLRKLKMLRDQKEMENLKKQQEESIRDLSNAGDSIALKRQQERQLKEQEDLKKKQDESNSGTSKSVDDEENIWTIPFANTLLDIPPGFIGEMVVRKSGKTSLRLGDVWFNVLPGSEFAFMEQICAVAANQQGVMLLGDVAKRVMCMPDIDTLLKDAAKAPVEEIQIAPPRQVGRGTHARGGMPGHPARGMPPNLRGRGAPPGVTPGRGGPVRGRGAPMAGRGTPGRGIARGAPMGGRGRAVPGNTPGTSQSS